MLTKEEINTVPDYIESEWTDYNVKRLKNQAILAIQLQEEVTRLNQLVGGDVDRLVRENQRMTARLQASPFGDDKIDELEEAIDNIRFQKEQLQAELDRLKAKNNVYQLPW